MFGIINSALLWAMAAIALPLMIHLLTRRKLKVVAISTIAFIKRLERENIRRLKIRQLLLLLLRMLVIALLVLAFARPTIRSNSAALAQRARATAVIILDNSLSMSTASDGVELLAAARQNARDIADVLTAGDEIYLITASQPAMLLPGSPFLNQAKLNEVLEAIGSTWQPTDLNGAFAIAREILSASHNVNRELYVLTDARDAALQPVAAIPGVRGYLVRHDQAPANNLTLIEAASENQIIELGKSFGVKAVIANPGETDLNGQLLHLYLNDKRVAQQSVAVPAGSQRGQDPIKF